jgi:hypothetical protein
MDKKKEVIAVIISHKTWQKARKRTVGTLKGKAKVEFSADFSITDEELLNSIPQIAGLPAIRG